MNERIKELWEQSTGATVPEEGFYSSASKYNIEKFAELIIKECVAKTMEVGEQNYEPIEPIWVANCIAHRIFKHFGVENGS